MIKHHGPKATTWEGKGLFHILPHLRKSGQKPGGRPTVYLLFTGLLGLVYYSSQDQQPRGGTIHSKLVLLHQLAMNALQANLVAVFS